MAQDMFRICPTTGLRIDLRAQALIKWNAVAGIVFLAIGGLFGLSVALTRWPAVHLLPADWFYLALTAHGLDVLLLWIIFFEIAVLYFAGAVLLGSRLAAPRAAWTAFVLMLVGGLMTNVAVLQGGSSVMFTSYVPMKAAPHFYLGLVLFAVGALTACGVFFGTLVVARDERTYNGSIPLVTFGALTAAIIAVFTLACGAIILIPTFLWSVGIVSNIDPLMYKLIWWGMGHSSQQINVSAHVAIWYAIAAIVLGAKPLSEKVSRAAFLLYILFLQLASAHHLLVEPALSSEWKSLQYELRHVSCRARQHDPRHDGARLDRGGAARQGIQSRTVPVATQGAMGKPGVCGHVPVARDVRIPGGHFRGRHGHRTDQSHHA